MADKKISALTGATTPLAGTEVLPIVQSGATVKVAVSDLTAGRAVSATQLTSTVAIGTAPLVVTSTTNVANLNASSLNGATFAAPGAIGGGTASAITGTTIAGTDATDASSTTAAAIKTAGGLAVVKKIYVGDNIVPATAAKGFNFTANTPAAGMTSQLLNWYEEGTFTGTLTGCTATLTTTIQYVRVGKSITISLNSDNTIVGTSNSTDMTITGAPTNLRPAINQFGFFRVYDAGAEFAGTVSMNPSGVMTFYKSPGLGFTAVGSKGVLATSFSYSL